MSDRWRDSAACIGNPHIFEPDEGYGAQDWETPRAICQGCPVRDACLADALRFEVGVPFINRWGMRGGLTPGERVDLEIASHRRPGVGRPVTAPCGTMSAYRRHKYRGEPIDDACRLAQNADSNERKRRRRERLAAAS